MITILGEGAMQSHLALWIVVCGIATAVTGCASMESSDKIMIVDNADHDGLQGQPASIAIRNGVMRGGPNESSPTDAVQSTITDLLSILGNEALKQPGRSEGRRHHIEEIIRHRVSYEQMAERALGVPWTQLNDTERQEFGRLFVQLLRDGFANKIDENYEIIYLFEQREGSFAEVRTKLIGPKVDTWLDFRLGNKSGDWLVYDVVIDAASIVRSYHAQFARIIRDDSYAGLVQKMKQRDLVVKTFEKTAPAVALSSMQTFAFASQ
jgi:phospholipid transport system substrate-binding protein